MRELGVQIGNPECRSPKKFPCAVLFSTWRPVSSGKSRFHSAPLPEGRKCWIHEGDRDIRIIQYL